MRYVEKQTTRHGAVNYYFRRGKGRRIRMAGKPGSAIFDLHYSQLVSGEDAHWLDRMRGHIERNIARKVKHARRRDLQKRAITSDITVDWAIKQIEKQGYRCAVTGIAFHIPAETVGRLPPFAPSLDRIDSAKGYTVGNVQIVIAAYNLMRLDWGDDVFDIVVMGYFENKFPRTTKPNFPAPYKKSLLINAL